MDTQDPSNVEVRDDFDSGYQRMEKGVKTVTELEAFVKSALIQVCPRLFHRPNRANTQVLSYLYRNANWMHVLSRCCNT